MDSRTTWPALIGALVKGETLTADEAGWAMNEIMEGAATPTQIAGFGVALRMKGETVGELGGLADVMLARATPLSIPGPLVDLVGTGGDGARTVNISTMGAIVAASAGARVAKHGNRAASSACGAADALEALGVVINLAPEATVRLVQEVGIGVPVRAAVPPGAAAYRGAPAGTRGADGLQLPRSVGQPGRRAPRRSASPIPGWAPSLPECSPGGAARPGLPRRRRAGRAHHGGRPRGLGGADGGRRTGSTRRTSGCPAPGLGTCGGPTRRSNASVARAVMSGLSPGRSGIWLLLNAGGGAGPRPKGARCQRPAGALVGACARAAAALDSGAAQDLLDRWVAASQRLAGEPPEPTRGYRR